MLVESRWIQAADFDLGAKHWPLGRTELRKWHGGVVGKEPGDGPVCDVGCG